jgi:hypothetical protein
MTQFLRAIALVFVLCVSASSARSQQQPPTVVTQVDLGTRQAGQSYPLQLNAQNVNCEDPMDFRFTSDAAWLRLPADPVVRGVTAGQSRNLQATIDLTNISPGQYQSIVGVECENCGWFVFKSCRVDKQQIKFVINVTAETPRAGPQQGQGGANPQAPKVDPKDPRIPEVQRKKLQAAIDALEKVTKAKEPCEEELKKLRAAADASRAKADKAAQAAKDAADKAAKAEEEAKKADAKADAADKGEQSAKKHAQDTERAQGASAKDTRDAKAAAAAAAADAAKAGADRAKANADARAARGEAQKAAKDAEAAAAEAKAAGDAADKKEKECKDLRDAEARAQAAKDAAAAEAEAAKPPPPPAARKLTPEEELELLRQEAERCWRECVDLQRAQRIAMETLREAGIVNEETYNKWATDHFKIVDGIVKLLKLLKVPGAQYGGLLAKGTIVGVAAGAKAIKQLDLKIKIQTESPGNVKKWLHDSGRAANPAEADRVYEQMERIQRDGIDKSTADLEKKKAQCEAAQKKYDEAKAKLDATKKGGE